MEGVQYEDEYIPDAPKCDCCGGATEYARCEQDGDADVYYFYCENEDCKAFETKDFTVEIELGWDC
tara:strand:+ start:16312 stop:16509 length:198 start_codon:yes stop_codon:yes gene_type:complete